jgi:hypothetical protein
MDIVSIGRWIMLIIGALALLVAIWTTLKGKGGFLMWVFGVLLVGIGSFGMEFIPKYGDWMKRLSDMIKSPGKESYEAFFTSVSKQKLPAELQQMGIEYAVSHPVEGMDSIIKGVTDQTQNPNGKKALNWTIENFEGKQRVIDQILECKPTSEVVQDFDQATAKQVFDKLEKLSPEKLRMLDIEPGSIKNYEPIIRRFPVEKHK